MENINESYQSDLCWFENKILHRIEHHNAAYVGRESLSLDRKFIKFDFKFNIMLDLAGHDPPTLGLTATAPSKDRFTRINASL
jgi:hypothetical protein